MGGLLLLGEGDFSFASALARSVEGVIVATGLEDEASVVARYCDARGHLRRLKEAGMRVVHGVDATRLEGLGRFEDVAFTHPHLGTEDCAAHYALLAHTFAGIAAVGEPRVHVTLAGDQIDRWRAREAAARHGYECVAATPFVDAAFPGYTRRRSLSAASFRNRSASSTTLSFRRTAEARGPPWVELLDRVAGNQKACDRCGRVCFDQAALERHRGDAHAARVVREENVCDECGLSFADPGSLRQHYRAKHDDAPVPKPDWFLEQQEGRAENDRADDVECPACGMAIAPDCGALERHYESLVPRERSALLTCAQCERSFRDKRALAQHVVARHSVERREPGRFLETLYGGPARCASTTT
ncbi:hypothetical protein CTAYLR_003556 [Chrysophaeum taylorii]|uniref:C2H2-type domain-containing protein n=1 Tax=Chrysophaeum taylorii TaxID=2483200 RepID=A0AAD7UL60_9STRA|nr:hypothetical protein CTAYLR_003556 [Chrysophaeum taylorii]